MSTITGARREQIDEIQNQIEQELGLIRAAKDRLQTTLQLMDGVSETGRDQMSRNASSSTRRRRQGETTDISHTMKMYDEIVQNSREAIRLKEEYVGKLQAEKQSLENFDKGI